MYKKNAGFTLIELLLVLGVIMGLSVLELQKIKNQSDQERAKLAGQELSRVHEAFKSYMHLKRYEFQRMGDASREDPNCVVVPGNPDVCELNLGAAFAQAQLMPAGWAGDFNILKTTLRGYIRRILPVTVTSPTVDDYNLEGIIFANDPWMEGFFGANPRQDLLGVAAKEAGAFAGYSFGDSASNRGGVGLFGGWSVPYGVYPGLTNYQLMTVHQVQSTVLNQFVRLDGTLPMTGDLNLGDYRINNVSDMELMGSDVGTNGKKQKVSSLMPNWVLKGVYSVVDVDADPVNGTVFKPYCADSDLASKGLPRILVRWTGLYNDMSGAAQSGSQAPTTEQAHASLMPPFTAWDFRAYDADNETWHIKIKKYYDGGFVSGTGLAEVYCYYP